MMERRTFLVAALVGVPSMLAGCTAGADEQSHAGATLPGTFEVTKTDAEWRKILTPDQYRVLRGHDTERPGSSPLNGEHRPGTYHCAGCDLAR